jgi:phage terminase large subunit
MFKQLDARIQQVQLTDKQIDAFNYLQDDETSELLFGGAAGGGKSRLGCIYGIIMSLSYERIRGCFAREELKSLKESTLLTFFDVCADMGLVEGVDYVYYTDSHILFPATGSTIYLKELKFYPSDSQYDYLGSTEYTWVFIDEAQQITVKAKNVMLSRIRYKIAQYNLRPRLLMSCNPHKGFLYTDFYKPSREGTLDPKKKFVQSLPGDNPLLPESYIENLRGLDKQTKERQLYGNWEYDDDPAVLCEYEAIVDMFTNVVPPSPAEEALLDQMKGYDPSDTVYQSIQAQLKSMRQRYIIADIARFGDDRTVITYWEGWTCKRIAAYTKLPLVPDKNNPDKISSAEIIDEWRKQYGVGISHILVDEDGVGGGPKDWLGCRGFVANRAPLKVNGKVPNFTNLKSQCSYYLASKVNSRRISVVTQNAKIKELLSQEMEYIKAKDRDKDGKLAVVPKDEIKKMLGRSPDFADTLMMRAYFDLLPVPKIYTISTK